MMAGTSFALTAIVLCCLYGLASCLPGFGIKADIAPVDPLVFIGETLKMRCQSRKTESLDMYFNISIQRGSVTWTVPKENITIVDNRTIYAEFEITDRFSSETQVTCIQENASLRTMNIHVERPIVNVNSFTGIYFYDNKTVITTWNLGEKYMLSSVNASIDWNPFQAPNNGNACDQSSLQYCMINRLSGQESIYFRIIIYVPFYDRPNITYLKPLFERSVTSVFRFVPLENMKTGPPEGLAVQSKNSTCMNIIWKVTGYFVECYKCDTIYRLEIKTEDEGEFREVVNDGRRRNSQEVVQICHVKPNTMYTLRVQIRALLTNPWSDPSSINVTTEEDRPLTGPPVTHTSYYSGDCVNQKRDIIIYWQNLQELSMRGQITEFHVVIDSHRMLIPPYSNYYKDDLDCDSTYEAQIYAVNKVGLSVTPSRMIIPKKSDELELENDLMFRVEETSDNTKDGSPLNVSVTWHIGKHAGDITLILYMCQEIYIPYICLNEFRITEVNADNNSLMLSNLPFTTNLFGFALENDKGQKKGIQWTNCVYRAEIKPPAPTGLHVSSGSQANSLLISWTSVQCDRTRKLLILEYHLAICSQPVITNTCIHVQVNSSSSTYLVTDLQGGKTYYVYIQAESPVGLGPWSLPEKGAPQSPSDKTGEITGIALAVITVLIALGVVFCCIVRRCKHARRHAKDIASKCPPILEEQKDAKNLVHQVSKESGIGTGSGQSSSNEGNHGVPPLPSRNLENLVHPEQNEVNEDDSSVAAYIQAGVCDVGDHTHTDDADDHRDIDDLEELNFSNSGNGITVSFCPTQHEPPHQMLVTNLHFPITSHINPKTSCSTPQASVQLYEHTTQTCSDQQQMAPQVKKPASTSQEEPAESEPRTCSSSEYHVEEYVIVGPELSSQAMQNTSVHSQQVLTDEADRQDKMLSRTEGNGSENLVATWSQFIDRNNSIILNKWMKHNHSSNSGVATEGGSSESHDLTVDQIEMRKTVQRDCLDTHVSSHTRHSEETGEAQIEYSVDDSDFSKLENDPNNQTNADTASTSEMESRNAEHQKSFSVSPESLQQLPQKVEPGDGEHDQKNASLDSDGYIPQSFLEGGISSLSALAERLDHSYLTSDMKNDTDNESEEDYYQVPHIGDSDDVLHDQTSVFLQSGDYKPHSSDEVLHDQTSVSLQSGDYKAHSTDDVLHDQTSVSLQSCDYKPQSFLEGGISSLSSPAERLDHSYLTSDMKSDTDNESEEDYYQVPHIGDSDDVLHDQTSVSLQSCDYKPHSFLDRGAGLLSPSVHAYSVYDTENCMANLHPEMEISNDEEDYHKIHQTGEADDVAHSQRDALLHSSDYKPLSFLGGCTSSLTSPTEQ